MDTDFRFVLDQTEFGADFWARALRPPSRLRARLRGHCVEAARLAISLRARLIFGEQLGRPASAQLILEKREPRRDFSVPGLYSQRCRAAFLHRPFPEVRRFISRNQVKMKLASGSPSGLVGGSTVIFSNAVLAPPLAAPSATADRVRRAPSLNRPGARPCLPLACNPMPGLCGKARDR